MSEATLPPSPRTTSRAWHTLGAALVLALLGFGSGFALYRLDYLPRPTTSDGERMRQEMRALCDQPAGANLAQIYRRNIEVFCVLCLGIGTAGLLTTVQVFWLGFSTGVDVAHGLAVGLDGRLLFWFLFPHGVPEIAAFLIAGSVGIQGAVIFFRHLRSGAFLVPGEVRSLLLRTALGLALLLVAGLIEVFVTPVLGRRYL